MKDILDAPREGNQKAKPILKTTVREQLDYTASMLRELGEMAKARRDVMGAYLIEMAYIETCDQLRAVHEAEVKSAFPELTVREATAA